MTTLKIPYNGVSYPLYLTPTKESTPALKVGNLGYAFLAQDKALGDPMLHGSSILKGAPLKVSKNGVSYRSMYKHGVLGEITCDVYYHATYKLREETQVVKVCTRYNQYGKCISWGNQTQYRYYWDTYGNIKINNFAIANGDMRIVIDNFICNGYGVLDVVSGWVIAGTGWGGWTTNRWTNYPNKASGTLTDTASGTYSLQINVNNTWVTLKTGTASCSFSVPINNENPQKITVPLELS